MPQIGKLYFNTIKDSKAYVRSYLHKLLGENKKVIIKKDNDSYYFLMDLLQNHPTRIFDDNEIKYFGLCFYGKGLRLTVNGFDDSISWLSCASAKAPSYNSNLSNVLRNEIRKQIIAFRKERDICEICKKQGEEVHHVIDFINLRDNFCKSYGQLDFIKKNNSFWYLKDRNIAKEWKDYHKENAVLQYLCKNCHKSITYGK